MTSIFAASCRLALVTVLLTACSSPTKAPPVVPSAPAVAAQGTADCGPCCGKNPAAEASATQGVSADNPTNPYTGKDSFANIAVDEGTILYSLTPGKPPGFAVTETTLRQAGGSWEKYYDLVQVTTDPGTDTQGLPRQRRDKVRALQVIARLCAASGLVKANPQFGAGGGTQYYVSPADVDKLRPGEITPISRWPALSY